jgi:branched-chain amino acid transport system permease protein
VNLLIGAAGAMVVSAAMAVVIGLPCLRLRGDYLAIATLGFAEIVRMTLNNVEFPPAAITAGQRFGGATGISLPNPVEHGVGYTVDYASWWVIWVFLVLSYVFFLNLKRSSIGRALMCIREDEIASRAMAINVPMWKLASFLLSAAFAGLAGALFVHNAAYGLRIVPNDFTLLKTIEVLLMVVLGGLGSFSGSILAAAILVIMPEMLRFAPEVAGVRLAEHRQVLYAILLITLTRLVPDGLLGMKELPDLFRRKRRPRPAE